MAVEWSPLALEIYHLIFPRGVGGIVVYGRSRRPRLNAFQETQPLPSYVSLHACACFVLSVHIYIYKYKHTHITRDATRVSLFRVRVGGKGEREEEAGNRGNDGAGCR